MDTRSTFGDGAEPQGGGLRAPRRFPAVLDAIGEAVWVVDARGRTEYGNRRLLDLLGVEPDALIGRPFADLLDESFRAKAVEYFEHLAADCEEAGEASVRTADGAVLWVRYHVRADIAEDGEILGATAILTDLTSQRAAEEELRRAEARAVAQYETLLDKLSSLAQLLGTARDLTTIFRALRDFAVALMPCDDLLVLNYDDQRQLFTRLYAYRDGEEASVAALLSVPLGSGPQSEVVRSQQTIVTHDVAHDTVGRTYEIAGPDTRRPESSLVAPMTFNGRVIGTIQAQSYLPNAYSQEHATAIRMAANLAAVSIENVRLQLRAAQREQALRQGQKMESIGRLAGGVAHDFNNLLTVMMGYAEILLRSLSPRDPLRSDAEEIVKAGERASALTNQLLAFSRKQILQPKVLNLNNVVANTERMLGRLIGEHIELVTLLDPALGRVKADPGRIEQVIVNLAVNARDAMPDGGTLTIETKNVELDDEFVRTHLGATKGQFVLLTVSDTGVGMDEETMAQIFEPFFTTKKLGYGTGLGLATVYGIVKQSDGYVWAASAPGRGASLHVLLPRVAGGRTDSLTPVVESTSAPNGVETVLIVEDEDAVRTLAAKTLRLYGYCVIEARGGGDALLTCEEYLDDIHLLVTDVVMPQMSGHTLASRLVPLRPDMKVLYMSGYAEDAIVHHGVLDEGLAFLSKPFTPVDLARKVREVLDGE